MRAVSVVAAFVATLTCADAFVSPTQMTSCVSRSRINNDVSVTKSSSLLEPVQSYADIWTPLFKSASESGLLPDFILHWGHGAAMATVLLSLGLVGAYMGWQIRFGNGEDVTPLTLGETIREAHPKLIGGAFFFFLLGGQGGLVLLNTQGQSILESPHAITAAISVALLTIQAILPKFFATENGTVARDAHAYLGTATMAYPADELRTRTTPQ
eukprot:scaffold14690_cov71-Cyclotella_meneghiniana.AAC.6